MNHGRNQKKQKKEIKGIDISKSFKGVIMAKISGGCDEGFKDNLMY